MTRIALSALAMLVCMATTAWSEMYLYMAEERGCYWCGQWNADIGAIYPKSAEGQTAPLKRFDVHGADPKGVTFKTAVFYTPTFILVENGQEIGRIEGYPGEDFFWGLLGQMIKDAES